MLHGQRAVLGTASVAVRSIAGVEPRAEDRSVPDPLLRLVRLTMLPVVGIAIFFRWLYRRPGS